MPSLVGQRGGISLRLKRIIRIEGSTTHSWASAGMLLDVQRAVASSVTPGHSDLVRPGTGQASGEVKQQHQKQRNSMLHTCLTRLKGHPDAQNV